MKILFIGCVKSSERFLNAICEQTAAELIGVVTKVKSNFNSDHASLHYLANQYGIDWIDYEDLEQLSNFVEQKQPDIIYCFGWSYLIPKSVYATAKYGAVGYHPALLPKNRGRHPIIWALALGLKETGSSFFYLDEIPDAGNILSQQKIIIDKTDDAATLYEKLLDVGEQQVVTMTEQLINGNTSIIQQDESEATYWRKRSKKDGLIDWRMGAYSISSLVRALTRPYVGAHFEFDNREIVIWKVKPLENFPKVDNLEPGKIIEVSNEYFIVKTGYGYLEILEFEGDFIPKVGQYL